MEKRMSRLPTSRDYTAKVIAFAKPATNADHAAMAQIARDNARVIEQALGVPAKPGTSETGADPRNPNILVCTACNGSGHYDSDGAPPCGACGGTGRS